MVPIGSGNQLVVSLRSAADVGLFVRERRKALGLTQMAAADQAGVGRRFLSELEDGKPSVQLGKVLRVLSMLGIALSGVRG